MDSSQNLPISMNNQQMLVIFNQVRPEKRDDFVQFINDVLCPAAASLRPISICQTRLLEPHVENADGSLTYVVLMDPAFRDVEEPVRTILSQAYGAEESQNHLQRYFGALIDSRAQYILADKDEAEL